MTCYRGRRVPRRRGLTLVEVAVSSLIVGLLLVAALRSVGAVLRGRDENGDRKAAQLLAYDLAAEILAAAYVDPDGAAIFGRESDEIAAGGRASFDDVDDYHNLSESPPKDRGGADLPNAAGLTRTVSIQYVTPANLSATSTGESGARRVTVTVSRSGVTQASLSATVSDGRLLPYVN